jgi:acyl transferase domain-containing protein/thioesterase domain-containing protein/NAD(P)-dependent dehydrogenase (short-subunit alcohol dehydrogenase family)
LTTTDSDIAIVGAAGRFPGARTADALWDLILSGRSAVLARTDDELIRAGVDPAVFHAPDYVRFSGMIEDVDCFDADFFGIGPRDAAIMDPQHRHFLECSWEALEHSGHVPQRFGGAIGVYAGSGMNTYLLNNLLTNPDLQEELGMFLLRHTSNDKDFLATTVSYRLNLRGPSVNVQTACSTSLVAVHFASQALLNGECDMALAGGVTIDVPHGQGFVYREGEILSRDGLCRAFDVHSSGTVLTGGVGVVVLRRLSDALMDGDNILAVIKGSAVNNDGSGKVGYLAPSVEGHASAVTEALGVAGMRPSDLQYIETHGTGTSLGDVVEIAALSEAFQQLGGTASECRLGSIKPTIGHADTAAGVAGLIKTALALNNKVLPPLANFTAPNPAIQIEGKPFTLSATAAPWETAGMPRRAGVSSLGVGGTNAHVVLEEAPTPEVAERSESHAHVLTLSARTSAALERASESLAKWLETTTAELPDIAFTLQEGRAEFEHRRTVVARTLGEASAAFRCPNAPPMKSGPSGSSKVIFMFPGGGSQYPNMGRALYDSEPAFRTAVEEAFRQLDPHRAPNLRQILYPEPGCEAGAAEALARPSYQLPAIFITEYALAKLWQSWGVQPDALTGHSLGECTAACLAGVFSLRDALELVSVRGSIMERVPDAGMLSVAMPESDLVTILPRELSLAAVNNRDLTVVSGGKAAVDAFERTLAEQDVPTRRIKINGAVHSALLDPFLQEFREHVSKMRLSVPSIPYVSNVTGTWIRPEDAQDPDYWVRHLRQTVRFSEGLSTLVEPSDPVFVEIGPGNTLSQLLKQHRPGTKAVTSLPHPQEQVPADSKALAALGELWCYGVSVDWSRLRTGTARRVPLPTYPFARDRHWIEPGPSRDLAARERPSLDASDWFAQPVWTKVPLLSHWKDSGAESWLVFDDGSPVAKRTLALLKAHASRVVVVTPGPFHRLDSNRFTLDPDSSDDFVQLFGEVDTGGLPPTRVLFFWATRRVDRREAAVRTFFCGPLFLAQAIAGRAGNLSASLTVVTRRGFDTGGEPCTPWAALSLGPVRVLPRERALVTARILDLDCSGRRARLPNRRTLGAGELAKAVLDEATSSRGDVLVALRGGQRLVQRVEPCRLEVSGEFGFKPAGVYIITGAFGGIGREVARHLAGRYQAKLVLSGRSSDEALPRLRRADQRQFLRELQALGADVRSVPADVTDARSVRDLVKTAHSHFGRIDGVIHAAGVLDDGPLQLKSLEAAGRVLAPKVVGALNVRSALLRHPDAVLVLFSSTSAYLGLEGQVDYTAANAFLDALAASSVSSAGRVVSLAWGMWRDTGMAASDDNGRAVATFEVRADDWRVSEHRLREGTKVFPGTAYIQAIHAAVAVDGSPIELENLSLLAPIVVEADRPVRVEVKKQGEAVSVGRVGAPSALGRVRRVGRVHAPINLAQIAERCVEGCLTVVEGRRQTDQERFLRLGPRWRALREVRFGRSEAIASLSLADEYVSELSDVPFHPALLDMATGFGLPLVPGYDGESEFYVPESYGRVELVRPLTPEVRAWLRLKPDPAPGTAAFDVTITDTEGTVLVQFTDFSMRRMEKPSGFAAAATSGLPRRGSPTRGKTLVPLSAQIDPSTGPELLDLALAARSATRLIVSPLHVPVLEQKIVEAAAKRNGAGAARAARPEQLSTYEHPRDALESMLAEAWEDLLGIEEVGIHDSFFDLGGHSLIAVRLFTRVRLAFGVQLALASLFEAPTIAALADVIRRETPRQAIGPSFSGAPLVSTEGWSSLVPIQPSGRRRPLFFVHGMYGNVLNLFPLSRSLGTEQPFYGLQQRGLNGVDTPHATIEEMAACYLAEVRTVQPNGPYQLGGYSGGGLIAFEMAHQLRAAGEEVSLLALLDTPGPKILDEGISARLWRLWGRVRSGKTHYLHRRAQRAGLQLRLLLHLTRAPESLVVDDETVTVSLGDYMLKAQRRYCFRPIDVQISLFRATTRDSSDRFLPRDFTWGALTSVGVRVTDVPGTHVTMCHEPNVPELAAAISERLRDAS